MTNPSAPPLMNPPCLPLPDAAIKNEQTLTTRHTTSRFLLLLLPTPTPPALQVITVVVSLLLDVDVDVAGIMINVLFCLH
jgi:hypothetical protein